MLCFRGGVDDEKIRRGVHKRAGRADLVSGLSTRRTCLQAESGLVNGLCWFPQPIVIIFGAFSLSVALCMGSLFFPNVR